VGGTGGRRVVVAKGKRGGGRGQQYEKKIIRPKKRENIKELREEADGKKTVRGAGDKTYRTRG